MLKKVATILVVEKIEPSLAFWTDLLGFRIDQQVEDEGSLAFVLLKSGEIEVHLQTRAATEKMSPALPKFSASPGAILYFDVEDLSSLEQKLQPLVKKSEVDIVIPRHKTFYGTTELYVREAAGQVVGFAQV